MIRPRASVLALTGLFAVIGWTGSNAATAMDIAQDLRPHVSRWQREGAVWQAVGPAEAAGWYLRSDRCYDMTELALDVRREQPKGMVLVYTRHWRVTLRPRKVRVQFMGKWGPGKPPYRHWTKYFWSATRPYKLPVDDWVSVKVKFDGEAITVSVDGRQVVRFASPHEEWYPRLVASGKVLFAKRFRFADSFPAEAVNADNQIVVLHSFGAPAQFRNVRVTGRDAGPADFDMTPTQETPYAKPDTALERLAPLDVVDVDWTLPSDEAGEAAALPATTAWRSDDHERVPPAEVWGSRNDNPTEVVRIKAGVKEPARIPANLHHHDLSYFYGSPQLPQELRVYVNLEAGGAYTVGYHNKGGGLGWGGNVLEIHVDGRPVSREVYRPFFQHGACSPIRDFVKLNLEPGPHRIDFRLSTDLLKRRHRLQRYLRIPTQFFLMPGHRDMNWELEAGRITTEGQKPMAFQDPLTMGERYGKTVHLQIAGLSAGDEYVLELGWAEQDVMLPGDRLMDVFVNGRRVEKHLDVLRVAGGPGEYIRRQYTVTPGTLSTGQAGIDLNIIGVNFKAFLTSLAVRDAAGEIVLRENCGWSRRLSKYLDQRRYHPEFGIEGKAAAVRYDAQTPTLFDGHNLVANPHMTLVDEQENRPRWWFTGPQMTDVITGHYPARIFKDFEPRLAARLKERGHHPNFLKFYDLIQGGGAMRHDAETGHQRPGALRVDKTQANFGVACNQPTVDAGRTDSFSVYVKADGAAGRIYPQIVYLASSYEADLKWEDSGGGLMEPRLQPVDTVDGESATGTFDWKKLTVTARPPEEALFALLIVRVDSNAQGTVWIDDADYSGYGVDPLSIAYSQLGFHPSGRKLFVIAARDRAPVSWRLVDESGREASRGRAAYHSEEWFSGRHYYRADLTGFAESGTYRLEASQKDKETRTPLFAVDENAYSRLCRTMLDGIHTKRWNCDLPGIHDPDALEDAHMLASMEDYRFCLYEKRFYPERRDMFGGWYDAGDDIRHTEFWPGTIFALYNLYRYGDGRFAVRTHDDAWDEAVWGWRVLPKYLESSGKLYIGSKPGLRALDHVPHWSTDRYATGTKPVPQTAGVAAMGAWMLRDRMPDLAQANLTVALKNYRYNRLGTAAEDATEAGPRLLYAGKALLAEIYLARLAEDPVYKERLDAHARMVAAGLRQHAYVGAEELYRSHTFEGGITQDWVAAACLFCQEYPDHPRVEDVKAGLRAFRDHVREVSALSPWNQARHLPAAGENPQRYNTAKRYLGYWPALAYNLSQIALVLNDIETLRLAEQQLQWCLGCNFGRFTVVHGTGDRMVAGGDKLVTRAPFFNTWLESGRRRYTYDGMVPTLSFRDTGTGNIRRILKGDNAMPPLFGFPHGYFAYYLMPPGYPVAPAPTEVYLPMQSDMALAAAGIYGAYRKLHSDPVR